ncbi:hypothetical protein MRX96_010318 [Rhipicephalus microplus]
MDCCAGFEIRHLARRFPRHEWNGGLYDYASPAGRRCYTAGWISGCPAPPVALTGWTSESMQRDRMAYATCLCPHKRARPLAHVIVVFTNPGAYMTTPLGQRARRRVVCPCIPYTPN